MPRNRAGSPNFYTGSFRFEMKTFVKILVILMLINITGSAQRLKDVAYFSGEMTEQLVGYGLVVGLAGTGDNSNRTPFTPQSISAMLKKNFGIAVSQSDLKTKNVAAVMVTATLSTSLKEGAKFDVNVSSLGDASSLQGGTLLLTPVTGLKGIVGYAQGPVSVGGFDFTTPSGGRVAKNHTLAGRVPKGGVLQGSFNVPERDSVYINLILRDPDLTTANNVVTAINTKYGAGAAKASDASEIKVKIPDDKKNDVVPFMAELEGLTVTVDYKAKVVLNERTGTVVAGNNVKIYPATISQGSLNITIRSYPIISQPGAFSNGTTQMFNNLIPYVVQDSSHVVAIQEASNVQEVTAALNSLKVSPRDIISIFQALKEAGALIADLIII